MAHQLTSTRTFTKYHYLVGVQFTGEGPEFYANPKEGCHNTPCTECVFDQAETCYIDTSDKAYNSILTYFQTNHPEKLI